MAAGVSILTLLCLLGILQGVLLAFVLGSLGGEFRRSNRLLGAVFLGAATALTLILVSHHWSAQPVSPVSPRGPWLAELLELLEYSLWSISGPLALLYVSLVAAGDAWPPRRFALHFAPGVLLIAYFLGCLSIGRLPSQPWLPPVLWMMLYQLTYTVLTVRVWRSAASRVEAWGLHRFWVPTLIVVLAIQHAAQLVRWLFRHEPALRDVVPLTGSAAFVVVTLIGLRRSLPLLGQARRRYAGSTLAPKRAEVVAQRLERLMQDDRPFLRPELGLEDLAKALDVPKTHLSQVLNETLGRSFPDFVARFRVGESEALLRNEELDHLTIEAVARRSGFRSRSAFYEAFRKVHGVTPAEYRKRANP